MSGVVFVTPEVDARPTSGGAIRTLQLLKAIAGALPTEVVVVGHATDAAALRETSGARSVRLFPGAGGLTARRRAAVHRWPLNAARWWTPEAARAVRAASDAGATVVLDHVYLDPYRPPNAAYVLSLHNVEADVQAELPQPAARLARLEHQWDLTQLRRLETQAVRRSRAVVVTVSERDAARLGVQTVVVDNGTAVPVVPPPLPADGRLTYVGSMTWPPNRFAVEWWLERVVPHLPAAAPPLTVVGRMSRAVFGGHGRLDVLDVVPDVAPVLAETSVVVVPLQHGGGTRLKVLEALAYGRPVVSTSKGVEGLPVRDGVEVLVADDGEAFARAVMRVRGDTALAARLGAAGRSLAEAYSWERLGERFADVVRQVRP
jgi:glycosyltransferase involved in cell wall biosynthesis